MKKCGKKVRKDEVVIPANALAMAGNVALLASEAKELRENPQAVKP